MTSLLVLETIVKKQIDYIHKHQQLPPEVIEKQKELAQDAKEVKKLEAKEEKPKKPRTKKTKASSDKKDEKQ